MALTGKDLVILAVQYGLMAGGLENETMDMEMAALHNRARIGHVHSLLLVGMAMAEDAKDRVLTWYDGYAVDAVRARRIDNQFDCIPQARLRKDMGRAALAAQAAQAAQA
jgi:hypothetical protein